MKRDVLMEEKKFWTRQCALDFKAKSAGPDRQIRLYEDLGLPFWRRNFMVRVWEQYDLEESIKELDKLHELNKRPNPILRYASAASCCRTERCR